MVYVIFDLLWLDGHPLMHLPYAERRARLERSSGCTAPRGRRPTTSWGRARPCWRPARRAVWRASSPSGWTAPTRRAALGVLDQGRRAPRGRRGRRLAGRRPPPRAHRRAARRCRGGRRAALCRARGHRIHRRRARAPRRDAATARDLALRERQPTPWGGVGGARPHRRGRVHRGSDLGGSAPPSLLQGPARGGARLRVPGRPAGRSATGARSRSAAAATGRSRPGQGPLSRHGLHEARRDRVPRPHRPGPAAAPRRAAAHAQALPERRRGGAFLEKQCPKHRPDWVHTAPVRMSSKTIDFCVAADVPTLVWLGNLADLELHTSMSLAADIERPTTMVFDLDPGRPATIVECCRVGAAAAEDVRAPGAAELRQDVGLEGDAGLRPAQRARHDLRGDQGLRPRGGRAAGGLASPISWSRA